MIIKGDPKRQLVVQIKNMYGEDLEKWSIENGGGGINDNIYHLVISKLESCFLHVRNKYYHNELSEAIFNPLHTAQWTMFLYQMAHILNKQSESNRDLCDKIYGISKCISSADIYYEVEMPEIWFFDHPQGSVLGRAEYSDYFTFSQGCTVGNNKGKYPHLGRHVSMMSGSKILGDCTIGDHVIMSANSYIIDTDIPPYSIVFGSSPNPIIHSITPEKFHSLTEMMFNGFE